MTNRSFLLLLVVAAAAGCYTASTPDMNGIGAAGPATASDPTVAVAGDLPCDLVAALSGCAGCHGSPLSGGAPNRLLSYDDLAGPSRSDPKQSVAELSVARMKDATRPMPPTGIASASNTAMLEKWIADGMPKGTCGGVDGVAGGSYDTPSVCTSGKKYTRGHDGNMRPGGACITCHSNDEGPRYTIAGTVYPTAHEPDDCNGINDPNVRVVITDANGVTITLTANSVGNFASSKRISPPYTAKIVSGTKVRAMATPQTVGDCNTCHTEQGTKSAPGRIMAP